MRAGFHKEAAMSRQLAHHRSCRDIAALHSRLGWPADAARMEGGCHAGREDGELVAGRRASRPRRAPELKRCAPASPLVQ